MSASKYLASADDHHEPLIERAFAAYFALAAREGVTSPAMPSGSSHLCEPDGRRYVILRNVGGVLAVYRVRSSGLLRRLRRYPPELAT
jgi:hypothetical protein